MTRRVRVLIVDDSVVVRRAVSEMYAKDPTIEVLGTASNGKIALDRIAQLGPDVVVLDVEMPEMNGLEALRHIRRQFPQMAVLMFSALTEKGAMLTLDALSLGASDYVTKPASVGPHHATLDEVRAQLLAKTHAVAARYIESEPLTATAFRHASPATRPIPTWSEPERLSAVVLGASTGGPNAVSDVLASFAPRLRVPLFIVQHMPRVFTRIFAERLAQQHGLDVREATHGVIAQPGQCWVAPGDYHMGLVREGDNVRLTIHQGPPENSCRPALDTLFRSAAACYGAGTLAVVLTGMGQDGLRGCEDIRRAGGQVVVQDEASSVVWSMPGSVARAGLAHAILPVSEIGSEIVRRVGLERTSILGAHASSRPST